MAKELGVTPEDILVIEDSVSGLQAALSAGMKGLAVSTPFTRQSLNEANLLLGSLIIDNPGQVVEAAGSIMK